MNRQIHIESKELREYLKEKFKLGDVDLVVHRFKHKGRTEKHYWPTYKILDLLQKGYELGFKEAQAKAYQ